jgi:predicted lipid-binding transport protein (Tim44 family)
MSNDFDEMMRKINKKNAKNPLPPDPLFGAWSPNWMQPPATGVDATGSWDTATDNPNNNSGSFIGGLLGGIDRGQLVMGGMTGVAQYFNDRAEQEEKLRQASMNAGRAHSPYAGLPVRSLVDGSVTRGDILSPSQREAQKKRRDELLRVIMGGQGTGGR